MLPWGSCSLIIFTDLLVHQKTVHKRLNTPSSIPSRRPWRRATKRIFYECIQWLFECVSVLFHLTMISNFLLSQHIKFAIIHKFSFTLLKFAIAFKAFAWNPNMIHFTLYRHTEWTRGAVAILLQHIYFTFNTMLYFYQYISCISIDEYRLVRHVQELCQVWVGCFWQNWLITLISDVFTQSDVLLWFQISGVFW